MAHYRTIDELYWPTFIDQRTILHRCIRDDIPVKLYHDLQSKK